MATKEQMWGSKYDELRRVFDVSYTQGRDQRVVALEDRRFASIPGAQWEGSLADQFANRPRFEVNKVQASLIRIFSEYRNNRISVDFRSANDRHNLADTLDGLFRADEERSGAQLAYDNAFEEAVGGGSGAWRLRAEYEDDYDEENEFQRIAIEPIYDADQCVVWDIDAKRQDKSDARVCFVLTAMSDDAFMEKWGQDPTSWPKDDETSFFDWNKADMVWVAEVYEVEEKQKLWHWYRALNGAVVKVAHEDLTDEQEDRLLATGHVEIRRRRIKQRQVHKWILSGGGILEDCGVIAGKHIPVVPVYGKRWFVDGIERFAGHVRNAKDAQRLKNMQTSRLAEIAALSPIQKPILMPEQVQGHGLMWAEDNIKDYPYLLLNPTIGPNGESIAQGPVGYTKPPDVPPAMAALLGLTESDIRDVLGSDRQGDQMMSNISAKAVELVQNRQDMSSFIYMDNMAIAMKRCGEIWLSMAKELYVEDGRKMTVVSLRGDAETVELRRPVLVKGEESFENDLSAADHMVVVDVGPSFTTRRDATVRAITGMMQVIGNDDPQTRSVLAATALMNMDGEGLQDVRDYLRKKLVMAGVIEPNEEERAQMAQAQQQPDPQTELALALAAEANAKAQKAQADVAKAQADTINTVAEAELTRAKTAQTLTEIDTEQQENVLTLVEKLTQPPQ